jgi:hypothetical protein
MKAEDAEKNNKRSGMPIVVVAFGSLVGLVALCSCLLMVAGGPR